MRESRAGGCQCDWLRVSGRRMFNKRGRADGCQAGVCRTGRCWAGGYQRGRWGCRVRGCQA